MNTPIIDEIIEQLGTMSQQLQLQVLDFARKLAKTEFKGTSGQKLIRFAGSIPADDLKLMQEAIEQDCKQLDINEW